jgi:hypothetical protein
LTKPVPAILALAVLGVTPALAIEPFTQSTDVRNGKAELTITFHQDKPMMVACTPEQARMIEDRAGVHITEWLPVLGARLVARDAPDGSVVKVLLDAACFEGGIMALAGVGRGDEKITLRYEESTDGKEWGPMKRKTITGDSSQ